MKNSTIYILGNGKMAQAIGVGLKNSGFEICYVTRREVAELKGQNCINYSEFDISDKIVILCFKPYNLGEIAAKFSGKKAKIIISPLANTSLEKLRAINSEFYARIMPNIAAEFNKSCTTLKCGENTSDAAKEMIKNIILGFGTCVECESEKELELAMAINGCAPAFLAVVAEALANGATTVGIKNDKSHELVKALFDSFASILQNTHPALIKEGVCSPAGVSIKGVNVLEDNKIRSAFINAVKASAGV